MTNEEKREMGLLRTKARHAETALEWEIANRGTVHEICTFNANVAALRMAEAEAEVAALRVQVRQAHAVIDDLQHKNSRMVLYLRAEFGKDKA